MKLRNRLHFCKIIKLSSVSCEKLISYFKLGFDNWNLKLFWLSGLGISSQSKSSCYMCVFIWQVSQSNRYCKWQCALSNMLISPELFVIFFFTFFPWKVRRALDNALTLAKAYKLLRVTSSIMKIWKNGWLTETFQQLFLNNFQVLPRNRGKFIG